MNECKLQQDSVNTIGTGSTRKYCQTTGDRRSTSHRSWRFYRKCSGQQNIWQINQTTRWRWIELMIFAPPLADLNFQRLLVSHLQSESRTFSSSSTALVASFSCKLSPRKSNTICTITRFIENKMASAGPIHVHEVINQSFRINRAVLRRKCRRNGFWFSLLTYL